MSIQEIAEQAGITMTEAWRRLEGWTVQVASTDPLSPADESMVRAIIGSAA